MRALLTGILSFILISIAYFYFLADSTHINHWEIRYYVILFIVFLGVGVFGVLRIYNAVVKNTGFIIELRNSFGVMKISVETFVRYVKTFKQEFPKYKGSMQSLEKSIDSLKEVLKSMTSKNTE